MSRDVPESDRCAAETSLFCARKHWSIYWLLIALAVAGATSRVAVVKNEKTRGDSPFFSANDRSRWCTVRSLVDFGTYEIDRVIGGDSSIHWDTIDKVRHVGRDGEFHYYSSKPTLLPTIIAGQYYLLQRLSGWNLEDDTLAVARTLLLINNVLPLVLYLWFLGALLERLFVADWTRYFIVACAGFGTFLTTFIISLNNHWPAAWSAMGAIYLLDRIWRRAATPWDFAWLGLLSAFAAANELPALSLAAAAGAISLWRSPRWTFLAFAPAAALVAGSFLITNYLAHAEWIPAYSHRHDGPVVVQVEGDWQESLNAGLLPAGIKQALAGTELDEPVAQMNQIVVERGTWMGQSTSIIGRWVVRDRLRTTQFAIVETTPSQFEIRTWNNWYDFPGSYWSTNNERRSQVDRGESSVATYAFHVLFGHHGVFSLTPLWMLSIAGLLVLVVDGRHQLRWCGLLGLGLTILILAFYLSRPEHDRNYGGMTSGLRWMFWLIPFWLVGLVPVVQWLASRPWRRAVLLLLLAYSIVSAGYSAGNPWVHPWLYELWMNYRG